MNDLKAVAAPRKMRIDPARIPEHAQRRIASAIYKAVRQDMERPEFREGFERWKAERAATLEKKG